MRLVAALCISAYASMACAQTQPNLDRLSASQPINGGATSPDGNKGNLSRRVLPAHSPPVAAVRRPPVPRAVLRQTCRPCPKVQRPGLIRSSARRAPSIRREVGDRGSRPAGFSCDGLAPTGGCMTACGTVMIGRNCFFNRSEIMASKIMASRKLVFLIVAFVTRVQTH
jgi:hypothetical protein